MSGCSAVSGGSPIIVIETWGSKSGKEALWELIMFISYLKGVLIVFILYLKVVQYDSSIFHSSILYATICSI